MPKKIAVRQSSGNQHEIFCSNAKAEPISLATAEAVECWLCYTLLVVFLLVSIKFCEIFYFYRSCRMVLVHVSKGGQCPLVVQERFDDHLISKNNEILYGKTPIYRDTRSIDLWGVNLCGKWWEGAVNFYRNGEAIIIM